LDFTVKKVGTLLFKQSDSLPVGDSP